MRTKIKGERKKSADATNSFKRAKDGPLRLFEVGSSLGGVTMRSRALRI